MISAPKTAATHDAPAIRRIAVAGHSLEAWLTVNHLLAGLGSKKIELLVCPVAACDVLDGLYAIIPGGPADGLARMGLNSAVLVKNCRASFSLGSRVAGQMRPYGKVGLNFLGLPFHHHWLRARPGLESSGYFDWSQATPAMQRNAFAPPLKRNAIGLLQHGIARHVDTTLLTLLLRERGIQNRVKVARGNLATVKRYKESDRIKGLFTDQGETIEADLYLDCSGPQRTLSSESANQTWVAAPGLPEFHISIQRQDTATAPPPFHQLDPTADGWKLEIPGSGWLDRVILSTSASDEHDLKFTAGHLAQPWTGNCLALGGAAATVLPVEPLQTRYLMLSVKRLLNLLVGPDCAAQETAEYNHQADTELKDIHDLTAAWELARSPGKLDLSSQDPAQAHDRLRTRLSLFKHRGWIAPNEGDLLEQESWVNTFIQLGLLPDRYDPLVDRLPLETLYTYLRRLKKQIEKTAAGFPMHNEYLNAVKSAPQAGRN